MKKVINNTFILLLGKVTIALCGFISTAQLTRYLGVVAYGQYAYIFMLGGMFFAIADYGLSVYVVRKVAREASKDNVMTIVRGARTLLSMVSGIALLVFAIYASFTHNTVLAIVLVCVYQWLQLMILTNEAYLQGKQQFGRAVLPQVIVALLSLGLIVTAIHLHRSLVDLFIVAVMTQLCGLYIYQKITPFSFNVRIRAVDMKEYKKILKEALPLALGVLLTTLYFKIDSFILGRYFSPERHPDVGIYSVAYKWFEIGIVFSGYFVQSLFPHLSSLSSHGALKNAARKFFLPVLLMACLLSSGLYYGAPFLIWLLSGKAFIHAVEPLRILAFGAGPTLLGGYFMSIMLVRSRDTAFMWIGFIALLLNIVINAIYIPHYSYIAAAWATVVVQVFVVIGYGVIAYLSLREDHTEDTKNFYEGFHAVTKRQRKIVSEDDYTYGPLLKMLQPYINKKRKLRILDVGCGTGSLALFLAHKGHSVIGLDISARAIDACRRYAKICGLSNRAQFLAKTIDVFSSDTLFDMICSIEVIEHVEDDQNFLRQLHKRLLPKGLLVLSAPSINAPLFRAGFLGGFDMRVGHLRRYDQATLQRKITGAGFVIEHSYETEGFVRNFMYTSTLGTGVLLRIINRSRFIGRCCEILDHAALKMCGASDIIIIARKKN